VGRGARQDWTEGGPRSVDRGLVALGAAGSEAS